MLHTSIAFVKQWINHVSIIQPRRGLNAMRSLMDATIMLPRLGWVVCQEIIQTSYKTSEDGGINSCQVIAKAPDSKGYQ